MNIKIDTTSPSTILTLLDQNGREIDRVEKEMRFSQSEELLQQIDILLTKNNYSKNDLSAIIVNLGPGSYTGVRVGVTTANFLAFSLNIPVIDSEKEVSSLQGQFTEFVLPKYGKAPFITKAKPRL